MKTQSPPNNQRKEVIAMKIKVVRVERLKVTAGSPGDALCELKPWLWFCES